MRLEDSSIKEIERLISQIPLSKLEKKVVECDNQAEKEWWERVLKIVKRYSNNQST